jgi:uncharacterized protein YoxC
MDPVFWLGFSILLVAVSLTAVLITLLPAVRELARAARSAEKLFDTLSRELPPTLEAIRLTGMEITDLTDDLNEGVHSAGQVIKQVDQGVKGAKKQIQQTQISTRSAMTGVRTAWGVFFGKDQPRQSVRTKSSYESDSYLSGRLDSEQPDQESRYCSPDDPAVASPPHGDLYGDPYVNDNHLNADSSDIGPYPKTLDRQEV